MNISEIVWLIILVGVMFWMHRGGGGCGGHDHGGHGGGGGEGKPSRPEPDEEPRRTVTGKDAKETDGKFL